MRGDAEISPCGQYRYRLRRWDAIPTPELVWVMLNPSTADGLKDDPTIRKCIGFAERWGFRHITVVNLFAYRATKPTHLTMITDPVGWAHNDAWIREATKDPAASIIAAWGRYGDVYQRRVDEVVALIGRALRCLGTTKCGQPLHPLMVPYSTIPQPWTARERAA